MNNIIDIRDYFRNTHDHYINNKCIVCGSEVVFNTATGKRIHNRLYLDKCDICLDCMYNNCVTTDCQYCKYGSESNCRFRWIKDLANIKLRSDNE